MLPGTIGFRRLHENEPGGLLLTQEGALETRVVHLVREEYRIQENHGAAASSAFLSQHEGHDTSVNDRSSPVMLAELIIGGAGAIVC